MPKKTKFLLCLCTVLILFLIFPYQNHFAKYVIENTYLVARLNIDRCKPEIELLDITSSNTNYPTYANQTHLIYGHIKITEKNIVRNNFSSDKLKVKVNTTWITPNFEAFRLSSEKDNEKIYEFSFTDVTGDGPLSLFVPSSIVEDQSGLVNESKNFLTNIIIDNTAPIATFEEIPSVDNKSKAQITVNEPIQSIPSWDFSSDYKVLSKEFNNPVSYGLPIIDFAQNSSEALVSIQNASNITLLYGSYDVHSNLTLVSSGQIAAPKTISSNSICKTESIFVRCLDHASTNLLEGRVYFYTHWGDGARFLCSYAELSFYHGYNPTSSWATIGDDSVAYYHGVYFSQLGGTGVNRKNATALNVQKPIPEDVAMQYPYGISGMQFRLKDSSPYSVVYQSYVKGQGWLEASCDGQENFYQHNTPITTFRMNLVPKTEKQYLMDDWNRDVGTNRIS